jgi:hydrogenase/urease accessory protein HupE
MHRLLATATLLTASASAAHAHPGGHDHLSLVEFVMHMAEPWHALPALMIVAFGVVAVRALRKRRLQRVKARRTP